MLDERGQAKTVEDAVLRDAALAGHLDTPMREIDFRYRMRVRIDAHHAAEFEPASVPAPVEVETPWVSVDFDRDPVAGAGAEDFLDIHVVSWPPQQLAPGHVAQNGRARIGYCANDALGLLLMLEPKAAVYAGNDEIECCQHLVRIVQRAIGQDVRLDPLEHPKFSAIGFIQSLDGGMLFGNFFIFSPPA